ncbi:ABC transporter permease [Isoptericola sp. NPDC057653]|uniref:ABC transporter permease n=1 Tax=Isoptericola sp. NPDC057653 TaxID=3346195 RepID=UPI003681CCB5
MSLTQGAPLLDGAASAAPARDRPRAADDEEGPRRPSAPRRAGKKPSRRMFLVILPFLLLVLVFSYLPLAGWATAFFDYRPALGLSGSEFVGLQWFRMLVSSPTQLQQIGQVMANTLAMSFLGIATSLLPVFFAMLLNEIRAPWFKNAVQTLTTLPNFISWVLVYMIAFSLFSTSGLVNSVLNDWGLITTPIKFLDTGEHVWLTMLLWSLWKGLGWGAIMYLAAITSIDPALYESARIDGAGRFQLMRYITFPQLMPTYVVLLVLSIANMLNNGMEQYYVFQNAFNKEHIQVLDLYVYNIGITGNSLSMATALGMLKSVISVLLLVTANAIAKRARGTSII